MYFVTINAAYPLYCQAAELQEAITAFQQSGRLVPVGPFIVQDTPDGPLQMNTFTCVPAPQSTVDWIENRTGSRPWTKIDGGWLTPEGFRPVPFALGLEEAEVSRIQLPKGLIPHSQGLMKVGGSGS